LIIEIYIRTQVELMLESVMLERVFENIFLGVIIDHNFSWKPHIKYVRSKLARTVGILCKTRHILNYKSLQTLYYTLILPYMTYCF